MRHIRKVTEGKGTVVHNVMHSVILKRKQCVDATLDNDNLARLYTKTRLITISIYRHILTKVIRECSWLAAISHIERILTPREAGIRSRWNRRVDIEMVVGIISIVDIRARRAILREHNAILICNVVILLTIESAIELTCHELHVGLTLLLDNHLHRSTLIAKDNYSTTLVGGIVSRDIERHDIARANVRNPLGTRRYAKFDARAHVLERIVNLTRATLGGESHNALGCEREARSLTITTVVITIVRRARHCEHHERHH